MDGLSVGDGDPLEGWTLAPWHGMLPIRIRRLTSTDAISRRDYPFSDSLGDQGVGLAVSGVIFGGGPCAVVGCIPFPLRICSLGFLPVMASSVPRGPDSQSGPDWKNRYLRSRTGAVR